MRPCRPDPPEKARSRLLPPRNRLKSLVVKKKGKVKKAKVKEDTKEGGEEERPDVAQQQKRASPASRNKTE